MSRISNSAASASRIPWGIVVVSLVVWGSLNSTVHASCGDYLHSHGSQVPAANAMMSEWSQLQAETPVRPQPCTGPACRRAPTNPTKPVPIPVRTTSAERLAVLPEAIPSVAAVSSPTWVTLSVLPQEDHRVGLERPPQSL